MYLNGNRAYANLELQVDIGATSISIETEMYGGTPGGYDASVSHGFLGQVLVFKNLFTLNPNPVIIFASNISLSDYSYG